MVLCTSKASLMHAVEDAKAEPPDAVKQPDVVEDNHIQLPHRLK